MSFGETVVLGALAGSTIFLGLPFARLRVLGTRARVGLAMFAVGVLAFLFVDVMSHGFGIVEDAVDAYKNGTGSFGHATWLALMLGAGFAAGSAGLAVVEARLRPPAAPPIGGGASELTVEDARALEQQAAAHARARAMRTGLTIAAATARHNFAAGLASGVSARTAALGP